ELRFSEDLIAGLEYSTFIQNAYILPDSIYYYNRLNEDGLSGQLNIENYKDLKILISEIRKFKYELHFLDLNKIINKRKYDFMIKLLKDHIDSKKDFYKVADFLVQNESPVNPEIYQSNKVSNNILKWVFAGKYFRAWTTLKTYCFLRKIK